MHIDSFVAESPQQDHDTLLQEQIDIQRALSKAAACTKINEGQAESQNEFHQELDKTRDAIKELGDAIDHLKDCRNKFQDRAKNERDKVGNPYMDREKESKEEERIIGMRKCIDFGLHVQSTKANKQRATDLLQKMKDKIEANKKYVNVIQNLSQEFGCMPLNLSTFNIQNHVQNFPQIEGLLRSHLNRQQSHPRLFASKICYGESPSHWKYKNNIKIIEQKLLYPMAEKQSYWKHLIQKQLGIMYEYCRLIKEFQQGYHQNSRFQQMKEVIFSVDDNQAYSLHFHKDVQKFMQSGAKIRFQMDARVPGYPDDEMFLKIDEILDFSTPLGPDSNLRQELVDFTIIQRLYEMYLRMKFEADMCQTNQIIGQDDVQYKSLQLTAGQKEIKSQLKLSGLMILDISLEFFPESPQMEDEKPAQAMDSFYTPDFLQKLLLNLQKQVQEPKLVQDLNFIVSQNVIGQILKKTFADSEVFKLQKSQITNSQFRDQLQIEGNQPYIFDAPQLNQIEYKLLAKTYHQGKYFYQSVTNKTMRANLKEQTNGREVIGYLERNQQLISDMGGEARVLSQKMTPFLLNFKILYQKKGFNLKLIENINDEIHNEIDWAQSILSQHQNDDKMRVERQRVRQEGDDLPELQNFQQIQNIAANLLSNV